jgi:cephalosporin hydroxylase
MWVYQELLHEVRPDLIVETGTQFGGSAYFLASMCELLGHGRVISVDIEERPGRPEHPRLEYLLGSSASAEIVARVKATAAHARSVLVVLDSEHSCDHVLEELHAYGPLVMRGSHLIVEDTNINGHPILRNYGPERAGPMEAIDEFLRGGAPFMVDSSREKFVLSFSPRGVLRRVGDDESVGGKPVPSGSPRELG